MVAKSESDPMMTPTCRHDAKSQPPMTLGEVLACLRTSYHTYVGYQPGLST